MAKNIAQLMVDTLVQAGVERVYGLPGEDQSLPLIGGKEADCHTIGSRRWRGVRQLLS
jgi:thiamine pyrophosphate-dependent acetolactate synthase large subunit-like protein